MTEMGSPVRQLGEVAQFINGGAWSQNEYASEGIPVVQVSNIRGYQIDLTDCKYLPKSALEKYGKHLIRQDDLIIATVGSHPSQPNSVVGRPAIARSNAVNALLNQNAVIVRSTCDDVDQKWLGWLGRDQPFRDYITGCARGSANQVRMAIGLLKQMPINIPPLKTQRRIAEILGAYDDLIEANLRRIAVLEEMARGLFTEWFIRLRFPGHENVAIEDTPDGPLPAGWSWGTAGDLLLFDPRTPVPREGEKPFIPMGHLDTATSLIAEPEARTGNSGAKFKNGDTLFARITPCLENGKTGLVRNLPGPDGVGFGSTEFIVMRGGRAGAAFSYCLSRLPAFRDHARMSMSGATGRQRARTDSVANFPITIPLTNSLFEQFEKVAWPMLELVGHIGLSNERLAAARNLLLPRLISGQLSVAQAARKPEAA